jgi:hypothetical protein
MQDNGPSDQSAVRVKLEPEPSRQRAGKLRTSLRLLAGVS